MAIYSANEQGVQALNKLGKDLPEAKDAILKAAQTVTGEVDSNQSLLGPHAAELRGAIEEIEAELESASDPIDELAEKVIDVADGYEEVISKKRFGGH